MSKLELRAWKYAGWAHGTIGQVRKYTGEPYIVHPLAVAVLVKSVPHTDAMVAAALLHDVVEDTPVTLVDIEDEFGEEVASLVEQVTDVSRYRDGNRATRKAIDLVHTSQASPQGKTIKLADLIDNSSSIVQYDPAFAVRYLQEKARLLEVLHEGDGDLWSLANIYVICGGSSGYL